MKIDHDCLVSVLEAIEETSTYYDSFQYAPDEGTPQKLRQYTHDQIVYHVQYCERSGYLEGCSILGNGAMVTVNDLSNAGHAYLKELRSEAFLPSVKNILTEEGKKGIAETILAIVKAVWKWFISFL